MGKNGHPHGGLFYQSLSDWTRTIAPLALTVVTAWSGLIVVMLPVYVVWIVLGAPRLVWNDAETGFALTTIAYIGLGPTMLGNLFYLYGVAAIGPARAQLHSSMSARCFQLCSR